MLVIIPTPKWKVKLHQSWYVVLDEIYCDVTLSFCKTDIISLFTRHHIKKNFKSIKKLITIQYAESLKLIGVRELCNL